MILKAFLGLKFNRCCNGGLKIATKPKRFLTIELAFLEHNFIGPFLIKEGLGSCSASGRNKAFLTYC